MKKGYWLLAMGYLPPSTVTEGSKRQVAKSKKQLSCDAFIMFLLLVTLLLGGCTSTSNGESEVMRELRKTEHVFGTSKLIQTSYFFYPSTMRMVNIDRMPNWDEAIKEVRRLSIFSMWPDRFDEAKQNKMIADLKEQENFALYAELDDKYSDFKLFGRNNGAEAIFIYNDSTVNYVVHLLGSLNYVKLMRLSADLRDSENRSAGLDLLVKAMGQDEDRAVRQRRYYDKRAAVKKAEQLRKDSIEAALMIESAIIKESVITE